MDVRARSHTEVEGLAVLGAARCAVLPYPRHAGMSRVLVESAATGTPVVAHDWGLLGHLVRTHGLGVTVDSSDAAALRTAVLSLSETDAQRRYAHALARFAARCCFRARVHGGKRFVVADAFVAHAPFGRRCAGWRQKPDRQVVARVNHLLTIG